MKRSPRRIYLDYAAGTPVDPRVLWAMTPYFSKQFGNPGSLHSFGQEAIAALDAAREGVARLIGAEFREVIFTASATEANNLALRGAVGRFKKHHAGKRPRIVVSAIEHESILETARELEREGAELVVLPVDAEGIVRAEDVASALDHRTAVVSIMYANNEVGSVEPIAHVARLIKEFRGKDVFPLFHTDAAQAFQFFDCGADVLQADMMTLSSQKIYGPRGAGTLYLRGHDGRAESLLPVVFGGGQEFGLRSGTENIPAIVGFAAAAKLAASVRAAAAKNTRALRERLWKGIRKAIPDVEVNGPTDGEGMPNILNIYFPAREAQDILTKLDLHGVAASSGSACRSRATESSYVIRALGHSAERARASVRFSLGRPTTPREIDAALKIVKMMG